MTHTAAIHVVLLVVSVATTAVLALYGWRNRSEHGARAFFGLMVAFTVFSGAHLVGLLTFHPVWRLVWENVQWMGAAGIPVLWALFAMQYTGHDEMIGGKTVAAMSVVPALTVVLTWTNGYHGLVWARNALAPTDGLALLAQEFGPWFWLFLIYTYGLLAVGSFLLARLVWVSDYLYADQSALMMVGVAVPVVASALTVFDLTPVRNPTLDITPYSFTISGLAFAYALFRRRLFDLVPATRMLGRDAAIRQLDDGVVIVDADSRIIYCNPTAADLLGQEVTDSLGEPVESFVDDEALDFGTEDALAEWERDDGVYEVRTSPINDQRDRLVGHTLVIQDVTARKQRERRLERQRDELRRLDELNEVVRGVNRALVSATSREEIEETVCEHLTDVGRYRTVCAADVPTWNGEADRWTVAGPDDATTLPPDVEDDAFDGDETTEPVVWSAGDGTANDWTVVPLVYGRTVYGGLGLLSDGESLTDREREVLAELGELIGHAIDATENRRLLAAQAVVELEFKSEDRDGTLLAAAAETGCGLELEGVVPEAGSGHLAYVRVEDDPLGETAEALAEATDTAVRAIDEEDDEPGGLVEWTLSDETLLGLLLERGANVLEASAGRGGAEYVVEVPTDADVRSLVDRVQESFPDTWLEAKREHERPVDRADSISEDAVEDLTDRQQEVLEVAYRAGYFDWPRESTGEEIAETLDITDPTFHAHLRKAEDSLLASLFDSEHRD